MASIIIFMINKDWMHASKEEIENMTYQDMLEIMESHIEVFRKNPNDGFCNIRPHWMKTLETCIELLKEKLKAQPCEDTISRKHLLSEIDDLMKSPWFNNGKDMGPDMISHYGYVERKEAVEIVRDLCIKAEPSVTPETIFKRPCSNCANEDSINICDQCCFNYDSWFRKKEKEDG